MEVIVEAFLSASFQSLIKSMTSLELHKLPNKEQVDKELEKWKSNLLLLNAVLHDAEEKQMTDKAVKIWLAELRDLAYDVEDVLDEFHIESLQSDLRSAESKASTSRKRKVLKLPSWFAALKPSTVRRNMKIGSELQKITARMEEIVEQRKVLDLNQNAGGRSSIVYKREPTTSLVEEAEVYGRDKDKEAIIKLLMDGDQSSDSPYSVIPIIGMGGVGKTTLAQLVYNDERVKFDFKAWVCVSEDYDIHEITKTILDEGNGGTNDLNLLQVKLKEKLSGKKFLIVLDDVWNEKYDGWTNLSKPFAAGAPGSRIIITTRNKGVSSMMSPVPAYNLHGLPYDECLHIFARHALYAKTFDEHPHLKEVAQNIVERCEGLPLAAKTLGGLLRGKQSSEEWEVVLNCEIWDLPEEKSGILPALRLSYHYLPSHLKQCFAYCAVFPKDYEFDQNELVLLWMAEGFLQKAKEKKKEEDLGHEYFNELLSRSFFQQSTGNKSLYVMHDLVSDLAQFVSGYTCFSLAGKLDDMESSKNVRHSSFTPHTYDIWQRFKVFYEMKKLRTFLAAPTSQFFHFHCLSNKVLDDLIPALKFLRELSLVGYRIKELPSSINVLKHLRYLNLSYTLIINLPESLCELFNLQTLRLQGCKALVRLPTNFCNLINLQHLDISDTSSLKEMPLQISKLIKLCTLSKFIVGEGSGRGIEELKGLSQLQGQLRITGLHNVVNVRDSESSKLKEKQGLGELALEWIDNLNVSRKGREIDLQVLNSLRPHHNLRKLFITSYGGIKFPPWVGDNSFTAMVELQLHTCRKITSLPSFVKFPALQHLSIKRMDALEVVVFKEFSSLETLTIEDMLKLEKWSWSSDLKEDAEDKFAKLRELTLKNCPMLTEKLPNCLPSLQKLHIFRCALLTDLPEWLPSLQELKVEDCHQVIFRNVPNFNSLVTLEIRRIKGLVSLHEALVQNLGALEYLAIKDCNQLKYLWEDGVDQDILSNVKRLEISLCEQLVSLVEGEEGILPCNLQFLSLHNCNNLEKLPNGLPCLTSLKELNIDRCKKLVSFPEAAGLHNTPRNLKIQSCGALESLPEWIMNSNQCLLERLEIRNCPSLKSFPCGKLSNVLKNLSIQGCENLESQYSFLNGIMQCDARELSHLEYLGVSGFSITSFPTGKFPPSLKTLGFHGCKIQSLPSLLNLSRLTRLIIAGCNELESFPDQDFPGLSNLVSLEISFCVKLRSLPNHMDSLQELNILDCSGLMSFPETGLPPKLTSLTVIKCKNLTQPISEWKLHTLTSLKRLDIDFTSPYTTDVDYFPDDDGLLLPTSLISLKICEHENLISISRGIQHLTSLEELQIFLCPKLHLLPKVGFPATLGRLYISYCPLLSEGFLKEGGEFWPIISHIPQLNVRK